MTTATEATTKDLDAQSPDVWELLIRRAGEFKEQANNLANPIVATAFSGDDRGEIKQLNLKLKKNGYRQVHFDVGRSSIAKGESIRDTMRTLQLVGASAVVIRHLDGARMQALGEKLGIPVINAINQSADVVVEELQRLLDASQGWPSAKTRRRIATQFAENSTRTLMSFQVAISRLGWEHVELNHADAVVVRHERPAYIDWLRSLYGIPVINAGTGAEAHPTQALTDLLTIKETLGEIAGVSVAIIGDFRHSRVAKSLFRGLKKFGARVCAVGPIEMQPETGGEFEELTWHTNLNDALQDVNVAFALRPQLERHGDGMSMDKEEYAKRYMLTCEHVEMLERNNGFVMHAGPTNEGVDIAPEVAKSERSLIEKQVENSVYARMAALEFALEGHNQ